MLQAILDTAFPSAMPPGRAQRFTWPWQNRAGHLSGLRAVVFALLMAPAAMLAVEVVTGDMGPEPWKSALKEIGVWAMRLLLITLAVTPVGKILAAPRILALRRLVGLTALSYALAHLVLYIGHLDFHLWQVAKEIALRFYLTIGFVALVGMSVLGWTSTDGWIRALGPGWKRLHLLTFPMAVLSVWHFFLQSKSMVWEAVMAAGFLVWLMLWRLLPMTWRSRWPLLLLLAPLAGLAAAGIEWVWFTLATSLPADRILAANLDTTFGLRPPVWVAVAALVMPLLALWQRLALRFGG